MRQLIPIVLLLITQASYGQYEKNLLKLEYTNSSGEEGLTTYIYNGKQHPYKAIWELKDGSRWSENYHEFDANGNMTKRDRTFSDSVTISQTFTYNKDSQLITETFSRSDGVKGTVNYFYEKGNRSYADCKGLNGWFHGRIDYSYNDGDHPVYAKLSQNNKRIGEIIFRYNDIGQLTEEDWNFDTGFSQSLKYEYLDREHLHYKSSNAFIRDNYPWIISEENYDYSGQGGGPSYYNYDDAGKLQEKIFVRSDGMQTITNYFYRDNGYLEKSVRHYSDGKTGTFTYTYDVNGDLLERIFNRSDGITGSEKYIYDGDGKLISGQWVNFDSWLTGRLEFMHDRYDRIISAKYTSDKDLSADIIFNYDMNGNLIKIHWAFSNGSSQTYTFKFSNQLLKDQRDSLTEVW